MRTKKTREVELELSVQAWNKLEKIAKRNRLSWQKVANMILECEVDVALHGANRRRKLLKKLKVKPTDRLLYCRGL